MRRHPRLNFMYFTFFVIAIYFLLVKYSIEVLEVPRETATSFKHLVDPPSPASALETNHGDEPLRLNRSICPELSYSHLLKGGDPYITSLAQKYPAIVVEQDYSQIKCDVAIIAAGFPRSGSTLQNALLEEAARSLGATVYGLYWQYHLHLWMSDESKTTLNEDDLVLRNKLYEKVVRWSEANANRSAEHRPPAVMLIKTHQYDAKLRHVCRHQLYYTAHRNLDRALASMRKVGWAWVSTLPATLESFDVSFKRYACWRWEGADDWYYDDMVSNPLAFVHRTVATLAPLLGVNATARAKLIEDSKKDQLKGLSTTLEKVKTSHFGVTTSLAEEKETKSLLPPGWSETLQKRYGGLMDV